MNKFHSVFLSNISSNSSIIIRLLSESDEEEEVEKKVVVEKKRPRLEGSSIKDYAKRFHDRRMEMLEEEHSTKMKMLNTELNLKMLEKEHRIKEHDAALRNLNLLYEKYNTNI